MNKDFSEISSSDGQFGMFGLLCFLNYAEKNPNLAKVTIGTDLTALGLNLTASEKLYPQFAGPWSNRPLSVQEIDYPVPEEYRISNHVKDKLQITLKSYPDDTIFFLFYSYPEDILQIASAGELYVRDWRFHKEHKTWLTRIPNSTINKTDTFEQGTYWIFNYKAWRREAQELRIEYCKLEGRPAI